MPLKRKAIEQTSEGSPTKRCTRSKGLFAESQPVLSASRRLATRPSATRSSVTTTEMRVKPRQTVLNGKPATNKLSLEASQIESVEDNDSQDDGFLLSSSKNQVVHPTTPPRNTNITRLILHSVEIVNPSPSHLSTKAPSLTPIDTDLPKLSTPRRHEKERNPNLSSPLAERHKAGFSVRNTNSSTAPQTPSSKKTITFPGSPTRLPRTLPPRLHTCLNAQKCSILHALQNYPDLDNENSDYEEELSTNSIALHQLSDLLDGTISRGEGNSCLILGPRGSGKTCLVEHSLSNLAHQPIIIRLSGWVQNNDRLAMREIAYQLAQQTGASFLAPLDELDSTAPDKEVNPFLDLDVDSGPPAFNSVSLPPPSHLPALISVLPTLKRPTVIILDAFDLFAQHARQSLLYCLLDMVQSCRVGDSSKGVAVIGVTSRIDTVNLLEKRVKSRFSGRMLRTATPRKLVDWMRIAKGVLCTPIIVDKDDEENAAEWKNMWEMSVDRLLTEPKIVDALTEVFSVTGDIRMLSRIVMTSILRLSPSSPFPLAPHIASAAIAQCSRPRFPFLYTLPYPSICLLIASVHSYTAGVNVMSFEMLHECFRDQVRSSTSAPIQVNGGGIGMMRCTREVLMGAFEDLVSSKIFVAVTAPSPSIAKEFIKYRCAVNKEEVKNAVEKIGQVNLKKWLSKAQ